MFHAIPPPVFARMRALETMDEADRSDGTARLARLRQVPPETGRFLALLAAAAPAGLMLEVGASGGYSGLWLSLACAESGRRLTTFELLPDKARLARATFEAAGVSDRVTLVEGDARDFLGAAVGLPGDAPNHAGVAGDIGFCFLDAEKDVYLDCYELVVPRLVPGGLLVADNVISHAAELATFVQHALADERVDALVVPIGKGELVCRRRDERPATPPAFAKSGYAGPPAE